MTCWGVIPAAGIGQRMQLDLPKQYLPVAGKCLLEHSLYALLGDPRIAGVVVVLRADDARAENLDCLRDARVIIAQGGAERSDSVAAGLQALSARAADDDWVLVHDAARPCLAPRDLNALIERAQASGCGTILALPVSDTVKRCDGSGRVLQTLERRDLWLAQTPQMFPYAELQNALAAAQRRGQAVTDEAAAMELAGRPVQVVAGSSSNLKVTTGDDIALAEWYLGKAFAENTGG